jgi:DsbC/DsbD-like thiol-disulfide interchange protein
MIRNLIIILAGIFFSVQGFAEPSPFPTSQSSFSPKINIDSLIDRNPVYSGDSFRLYLSVQIEEGWHIYSLHPLDGNERLATRIILEENIFESAGRWQESPVSLIQDDAQDKMVKGHTITAEFHKNFNVPQNSKPGKHFLTGKLLYQACDNNLCALPQSLPFTRQIQVGIIKE